MMRRSFFASFAVTALAALGAGGAHAEAPAAGPSVFANHCAVCHGPEAGGIPGSFPALHEQIVAFAKTPAGRDYLVMVVTTGLIGDLQVGGGTYHGVMPPQSTLTEAEVASALNYLASGLGKLKNAAPAFNAKEVAEIRARHPDKTPQATHALRPVATAP
jgi:mono/diheme cytochrome c family protein